MSLTKYEVLSHTLMVAKQKIVLRHLKSCKLAKYLDTAMLLKVYFSLLYKLSFFASSNSFVGISECIGYYKDLTHINVHQNLDKCMKFKALTESFIETTER